MPRAPDVGERDIPGRWRGTDKARGMLPTALVMTPPGIVTDAGSGVSGFEARGDAPSLIDANQRYRTGFISARTGPSPQPLCAQPSGGLCTPGPDRIRPLATSRSIKVRLSRPISAHAMIESQGWVDGSQRPRPQRPWPPPAGRHSAPCTAKHQHPGGTHHGAATYQHRTTAMGFFPRWAPWAPGDPGESTMEPAGKLRCRWDPFVGHPVVCRRRERPATFGIAGQVADR